MSRRSVQVRYLLVMTIIVIGIAATALQPTRTASAAGSAPVLVTNTPLPVTVQGTASVSGTVNATQTGTWNVGVTSLPAIQLAEGATVGLHSSFAMPIYTSDVDTRSAYALSFCSEPSLGCPDRSDLPAGRMFVIEQVSGSCQQTPATVHLSARLNGSYYQYFFRDSAGAFTAAAKIYADSIGPNAVIVSASPAGLPGCQVTVSGYLVTM
jgi:hypothetical protein